MKKILLRIMSMVLILSLVVAGLTACGDDEWEGTTMTDWGKVESVGGFVAETENYIYYINGIADSTADNTFGVPVKGALMAADKDDLSNTEIVVPKLFAAADYKSGLFIDGDYVYYGSPNTEKAGSGEVANSELKFMKTKLDGTDTTEFFTVNSLSTEYRIVKGEDTVYIVYYDTEETALIAYDTAADEKTVIAKTDAKTDGDYSLASHNFLESNEDGVVVVYTVNVYSEKYYEEKAAQNGYSRATESYNEVYAYKVGDKADEDTGFYGEKVLGDEENAYAISLVKNGYVFYTETPEGGTAKTYAKTVADLYDGKDATEIKNTSYVADANVIVSLDEVYTFADGKIYKVSLTGNDKLTKQVVAASGNVSTLLFVINGEMYFINTTTQIAKIKLGEVDAKEIRVSNDVVSTAWYPVEVVDGKLFYLDSSAVGASYVHYVELDAELGGEDTDDDGKVDDALYLKGAAFVGQMTDADQVSVVTAKINNIANNLENGALVYEEDEDGELFVEEVEKARKAYDDLSDENKETIDAAVVTTLTNYEKAIEMENLYAKLDGMYYYNEKSKDDKEALEDAYDQIKADVEEFRDSDTYSAVSAFMTNNRKANYDLAVKQFEAEE